MQEVEIDGRRIVHHVGVMLAGEDVAGPSHVGGNLIDFVEAPIDHLPHKIRIAKVTDQKIVRFGFAKARKLAICASNPEALAPLPPHLGVHQAESITEP